MNKISPILEYGSAVWSSFVSQDTLNKIDRFQKEYFRKAMGLPSRSPCADILCDFSVVRQSLRFESNRMKLRAKLEFNLVPRVLKQQYLLYSSTKSIKLKYFIAATRRECIENRDKWLTRNPSDFVIPGRETFADYKISLNNPHHRYDYHYRSLYPNGDCKSRPWKATLRVHVCPTFPKVKASSFETTQQMVTGIQREANVQNVPFHKLFKRLFPKFIKAWNTQYQWKEFCNSRKGTLSSFREGWYHDNLLYSIRDPYMRLIRKCRLGVSELACHSHYRDPSCSKICAQCNLGVSEDLQHYFFECPAFHTHRKIFLNRIKPLLDNLGLPQGEVAPVLGFPEGSASKRYFKTHMSDRKQLYLATCTYMRSTQRFQFV